MYLGLKHIASFMFTWPNVSIKQCGKVLVSCKVTKCERASLFGDLLQIVDSSAATIFVQQIQICCIPKFAEPVHFVSLDGPVDLSNEYGMNVLFCLFEKYQQTLGFVCQPETDLRC